MQNSNQIGYVIWGIKHEFSKRIFSNNIDSSLINNLIDVRDLFQGNAQYSYSIEKFFDYTLVTLYDPATIDSSESRKAYIAFTISIKNDYLPNGNILDWLNELKSEYYNKGNYAMKEHFNAVIDAFSVVANHKNSSRHIDKRNIGYYDFSSPSEILEIFSDLDIMGYQKIHFFNQPNGYVVNNPNFEKVTTLERKYSVQIINFIPHEHQLYINDIHLKQPQIISGKVEINDLRKTDKIEIKRGSNQSIEVLIAKDKQLVTLPLPKIEHQGYFTIRGLDPSRYRVKVNGQEQPTSHMSGSELKIAISTEHVFVEIVDKITNANVQTHDTRINKTYVMLLQGGNGTNRPPGVGTGGNGGSGRGGEEPPKKSKTALILTLCSVVLLAGLAITGWQLGWFGGEKEKPPVSGNGTKNTTPNVGSDNEGSNENEPEENKLVNPDGYTVKTGNESILTSKGLLNTTNNRFYRFFNGKWEYSEKTTSDQWKDVSAADKTVVLVKYFSINTAEQNKVIEAEKVKNDDPLVKKDEKGQDDKKKEEKDPCKAICAEITRLVGKVITKKSPELAKFKEDANKVINSECDCKGGQSNLKVKLSNL
jgi:hypothetical protein